MITIDLPADLNFEDDDRRNVARLSEAPHPEMIVRGAVIVAGRPDAWSRVIVDEIEADLVYFRQIEGRAASKSGLPARPAR
jgi:hypothetical protein